ncbi:DNA replication initiation factor cdc45 [Blastocladiella emersonii ATCC 22665]|nr:DNA replication initiation factor cdc45 [Blastocladiella emersonii ATCC 22665]
MYLPLERYDEAYERIKEDAQRAHGAETVLVLVAPDVDAVCACRLLVSQFRHDWIAHKVVPVATYSELLDVGAELIARAGSEVRSVILVNCGGIVAVADMFPDLRPDQRVYVVESRRPLNLDNVFGNELVTVLDDGHIDRELAEERAAYEAMAFGDVGFDDEDEDDDEDDDLDDEEEEVESERALEDGGADEEEEELAIDDPPPPPFSSSSSAPRSSRRSGTGTGDEDDSDAESRISEPPPYQEEKENAGSFAGGPKAKRSRFALIGEDSDVDDDDESGPVPTPPPRSTGDLAGTGRPAKRKRRPQDVRRERRLKRRRSEATLFAYQSQGTWTGTAAALAMFHLINQLGRATVTAAWLASVGITSQYQLEEIAESRYLAQVEDLDAHLQRLSSTTASAAAAAVAGGTAANGAASIAGPGTVARTRDWRLPLYRHWTLYDALRSARGPATRLSAWTDAGKSRLRFLFAKLGVAVDQYTKPFAHMDSTVKETLQGEFVAQAPLVGLDRLEWTTFVRTTAVGTVVAAADMVAALWALAVHPNAPAALVHHATTGGSIVDLEALTLGSTVVSGTAAIGARPDAFYAMLDALNDDRRVAAGIETAKLLTTSIMSVVGTLISRHAIRTLRGLRYALVRDVGDAAGALRTPNGVRELALVLFAALREIGRADLPLIVGVLQPAAVVSSAATDGEQAEEEEEDMYLLVGHVGASEEGLVRRNRVGLAFQEAAAATQARHSHDAFDPTVIWVVKDDVTDFVEQLQMHLGAPPV